MTEHEVASKLEDFAAELRSNQGKAITVYSGDIEVVLRAAALLRSPETAQSGERAVQFVDADIELVRESLLDAWRRAGNVTPTPYTDAMNALMIKIVDAKYYGAKPSAFRALTHDSVPPKQTGSFDVKVATADLPRFKPSIGVPPEAAPSDDTARDEAIRACVDPDFTAIWLLKYGWTFSYSSGWQKEHVLSNAVMHVAVIEQIRTMFDAAIGGSPASHEEAT